MQYHQNFNYLLLLGSAAGLMAGIILLQHTAGYVAWAIGAIMFLAFLRR